MTSSISINVFELQNAAKKAKKKKRKRRNLMSIIISDIPEKNKDPYKNYKRKKTYKKWNKKCNNRNNILSQEKNMEIWFIVFVVQGKF